MKPRWLLLVVGVVCLLVLAPAAALSQGGTEIACGTAVIDGTVGTAEWADATRLPMGGEWWWLESPEAGVQMHGSGFTSQVHPAQGEAEGWLYLKNDERYLYVGATMDIGDEHWQWWKAYWDVAFTDEPCGEPGAWVDDKWEKDLCTDLPGEGFLRVWEDQEGTWHHTKGPMFQPVSEEHVNCEYVDPTQGVIFKFGQHTAHYEMRIDLEGSELNCAGPGDCFRFWASVSESFCPADDPECPGTVWTAGWVAWPALTGDETTPDIFGTICLNPCEVQEEFVPEPGTMLLFGSGLASLAGYAGLRRRERS